MLKGNSERGDSALKNMFAKEWRKKLDICSLEKRTHKRHLSCFEMLKGCHMEKGSDGVSPAGRSYREAYFSSI